MTRERRASRWWLLALAAAVPAVISGILALDGKWAPTIDNGVIAVRTYDVLTLHPPLVGVYLSLTVIAHSHTRLHYLGPLQFWLLALPLRAGGPNGVGLMLGAAALNALAVAGSVWIAHRLAGIRLAAIVAAATGLLAWSLGGQVLHDPWSPHLALFPFWFVLFAAAATAAGDVKLLPLAAFAASFVLQTHVTYVIPVALVTIWAAIGLVLNVRGSREREVMRRETRRSLIITGAVLAVCWIGPLLDLVFGSHNATNVAGAGLSDYPRVGIAVGWRDLVHATSIPPIWLEPFTGIVKVDRAPTSIEIVTSLLVLTALGAATWWAWARRSWSHLTLCTTAIVAAAGAVVTSSSSPVDYHSTEFLYPRRLWWMIGVLIWVALAHAAVTLVTERAQLRVRNADAVAIGAGLVVIAIAIVAVWPRLGPAQDYGSAGFGPVRNFGTVTAKALPGDGPWELRTEGEFASNVVGPGFASGLIMRGKDVRVADANFPDLGGPHFVKPDDPPTKRVLLVSGPQAGRPIPGYTLVGRWDPATAPEPYRSYHQTLLVVPLDPVAAYVSTPT